MVRASVRAACVCVAAMLVLCDLGSLSKALAEEKGDAYDAFNRFCISHFGAEKEPLVYEKFGRDLRFLPDGSWRHVSENSACIAWETNLPAKSYVEYGETPAYGKSTPQTERHFYLHLHYLKGLETGKTCHYRLVSTDERGNTIRWEDRTLTAQKSKGAIHLPGDLEGPPYELKERGATYVLKQDVSADGSAIRILAPDITLDLNGHTVTYDRKHETDRTKARNLHGILGNYHSDPKIFNGVVVQGEGNTSASASSRGVRPVTILETGGEIAGLTCIYRGNQITGMRTANSHVHHNVVEDRGTEIQNRHQGCGGIAAATGKVHHNLIKRARHKGIGCIKDAELKNNEIYIDSFATNGAGIFLYRTKNALVENNRIFATGYTVFGIGPIAKGGEQLKIHSNLVHVDAMKPTVRSKEYGAICWTFCLRLSWGAKDVDYHNNLLIANGRDGSWTTGTRFQAVKGLENVVFRNNTVKMTYEGKTEGGRYGKWSTAIDVDGGDDPKEAGVIVFRDNRIISNYRNVGGDGWYGAGSNAVFRGNTFVRVGNRADYYTIYCGFWTNNATGFKYYDSSFEGGAGYDAIEFDRGTGKKELSVGWTLTVKTAPDAKVTIKDRTGAEVFRGETDPEGGWNVALVQYIHRPEGKTDLTPHMVTIEKDGKTVTRTITMDRQQELVMKP